MSTDIVIFVAVIAVSLAGTVVLTRCGRRRESTRDRLIREARARVRDADAQRWATEPGALAELDELELLYSLPAYDPALDAGCERLWDAVRDEQHNQKGD